MPTVSSFVTDVAHWVRDGLLTKHYPGRYIVEDADVYRAGYALHLANLMTRAYFAHQLQIFDLPQCVAYFSAVDIDKVIRKETNMHCLTPSNPVPVPPGLSLDIHEIGERCGWSLEVPNAPTSDA
jgi:DNA polymerase gamma 1